tara:strand:+ start:180 stop:470 length:291 start_codon:yes stop_codon:yes gene_type:complete
MPRFDDCVSDLTMPEGWEDVSYGNDACPSWAFNGFQVFIEHANPKEREVPEWSRFWIIREADYGIGGTWSAEANTFDEVLKVIDDVDPFPDGPSNE